MKNSLLLTLFCLLCAGCGGLTGVTKNVTYHISEPHEGYVFDNTLDAVANTGFQLMSFDAGYGVITAESTAGSETRSSPAVLNVQVLRGEDESLVRVVSSAKDTHTTASETHNTIRLFCKELSAAYPGDLIC